MFAIMLHQHVSNNTHKLRPVLDSRIIRPEFWVRGQRDVPKNLLSQYFELANRRFVIYFGGRKSVLSKEEYSAD